LTAECPLKTDAIASPTPAHAERKLCIKSPPLYRKRRKRKNVTEGRLK